jgi:hypothetical protein
MPTLDLPRQGRKPRTFARSLAAAIAVLVQGAWGGVSHPASAAALFPRNVYVEKFGYAA